MDQPSYKKPISKDMGCCREYFIKSSNSHL